MSSIGPKSITLSIYCDQTKHLWKGQTGSNKPSGHVLYGPIKKLPNLPSPSHLYTDIGVLHPQKCPQLCQSPLREVFIVTKPNISGRSKMTQMNPKGMYYMGLIKNHPIPHPPAPYMYIYRHFVLVFF